MPAELRRVAAVQQNGVALIVFIDQRVYFILGHVAHGMGDLAGGIGVHFPAEDLQGFHLVALGDGHVAHIVGHAEHADPAALHHADGGAHPGGHARQHLLILPVAGDHLALDAKAGNGMAVLPVAVGGLVFIHEVHVDAVIGDLAVELGQQMHQGLAEFLQPRDPGLGGREGMHPGDHAGAVVIRVGLVERGADHAAGEQRGLERQGKGQKTRSVDALHHDAGMLRHMLQALRAVQILRTDAEPECVLPSKDHNPSSCIRDHP